MSDCAKKWLKFSIRWGIAVAGIAWVVMNMTIRDRVTFLDDNNRPVHASVVRVEGNAFVVLNPETGLEKTVVSGQLVHQPDRGTVAVRTESGTQWMDLLALDLTDDLDDVERLLVAPDDEAPGQWILPAQAPEYVLSTPHPLVEAGIGRMVREADTSLLLAAILVFPVTFLLTAYRWNELLKVLDIRLGQMRTFTLNMVGQFYSTFMPGSTGGDLLKAYYASKHTEHRTRAVLSVIVDRAIGLLALIILGGVMAAYQWQIPACRNVAMVSGAIIGGVILGLAIYYTPVLRKLVGLDFILSRLPGQKYVQSVVYSMELYRQRPLAILWALLVTFPVHMSVVVSAMFAGKAFGLRIEPLYYWAAVPVIVLVGAIPISPQGAGVMEFFAILLLRREGATVSQAFALTMSIRLVQMFWNLAGGVFVFRGGYHAPTEKEQKELEADSDVPPPISGTERVV